MEDGKRSVEPPPRANRAYPVMMVTVADALRRNVDAATVARVCDEMERETWEFAKKVVLSGRIRPAFELSLKGALADFRRRATGGSP